MKALVVVDMQNDFIDGALGTPAAQAIVDNVVKKVNEFDGDAIYITKDTHKRNYLETQFYTMDLPIIGYEEGSGRLAGTLGAFILDYQGNPVNVGSGFSDEQRVEFWKRRDELIGVLCEVKYKEISSDKKTKARSLQFPTFETLRTDKSDVSYG